jgi:hypothetical protein
VNPLNDICNHTKSPIEQLFADAFVRCHEKAHAGDNPAVNFVAAFPGCYDRWSRDLPSCYVMPQARIACEIGESTRRYTADFLFVVGASRFRKRAFVVECDGLEWHAKSAEQVARDKARDRHLLSIDIPTIRFTGSELFSDADGCAGYVMSLIDSTMVDCLYDASKDERLANAEVGATKLRGFAAFYGGRQ